MILRNVETEDLNKVALIGEKVDVIRANGYEYKRDTAWFKVKSYDTVYTIEVEIKW